MGYLLLTNFDERDQEAIRLYPWPRMRRLIEDSAIQQIIEGLMADGRRPTVIVTANDRFSVEESVEAIATQMGCCMNLECGLCGRVSFDSTCPTCLPKETP